MLHWAVRGTIAIRVGRVLKASKVDTTSRVSCMLIWDLCIDQSHCLICDG